MTFDRWEQRCGLWVRRRDDGDWDYFPSLSEPASGYRVGAAFFDRIKQSSFVGMALAYGLGAPVMLFALALIAMHPSWNFLGHLGRDSSRGFGFLAGLLIVAGALLGQWFAGRAMLARAAASDTVLSADEVRDLVEHIAEESGTRPAISAGARQALSVVIGAIALVALILFVMALVNGAETAMLVTGIVATLSVLLAMRLWHLSRGIV